MAPANLRRLLILGAGGVLLCAPAGHAADPPTVDQCRQLHAVVAEKQQQAGNQELIDFAVCAEMHGDLNAKMWSHTELAQRGYPPSQHFVGVWHLHGEGVPVDTAKAFHLINASAEAGFVPAQKLVGALYIEGVGVARDVDEGMRWWRRAAAAGDPEARQMLAQLDSEAAASPPPAPAPSGGNVVDDVLAEVERDYGGNRSSPGSDLADAIRQGYGGSRTAPDPTDPYGVHSMLDELDRGSALLNECQQNVPGACARYAEYRAQQAARLRGGAVLLGYQAAEVKRLESQIAARKRELGIAGRIRYARPMRLPMAIRSRPIRLGKTVASTRRGGSTACMHTIRASPT